MMLKCGWPACAHYFALCLLAHPVYDVKVWFIGTPCVWC